MENTTITASITYPTADIEAFADAHGYMEMVEDPATGEMIENSETRIEYVKRIFLEKSLQWFSQLAEAEIRRVKALETQELVDTKRNELRQYITIN